MTEPSRSHRVFAVLPRHAFVFCHHIVVSGTTCGPLPSCRRGRSTASSSSTFGMAMLLPADKQQHLATSVGLLASRIIRSRREQRPIRFLRRAASVAACRRSAVRTGWRRRRRRTCEQRHRHDRTELRRSVMLANICTMPISGADPIRRQASREVISPIGRVGPSAASNSRSRFQLKSAPVRCRRSADRGSMLPCRRSSSATFRPIGPLRARNGRARRPAPLQGPQHAGQLQPSGSRVTSARVKRMTAPMTRPVPSGSGMLTMRNRPTRMKVTAATLRDASAEARHDRIHDDRQHPGRCGLAPRPSIRLVDR